MAGPGDGKAKPRVLHCAPGDDEPHTPKHPAAEAVGKRALAQGIDG